MHAMNYTASTPGAKRPTRNVWRSVVSQDALLAATFHGAEVVVDPALLGKAVEVPGREWREYPRPVWSAVRRGWVPGVSDEAVASFPGVDTPGR